tara:strand:+ start:774 stop:935 length:162 start_codon:yes stop_codon:yes gene_type:complete
MIDTDQAMKNAEMLYYDADLDYVIAERLGIDVEDLERCPKTVYDALLRYFYSG